MEFDGLVFSTDIGEFAVELYWQHSPVSCQKLVTLAQTFFYEREEIFFEKVLKGVLVQTGDPSGTSFDKDKSSSNEVTESLKHVGAGVVSLATDLGTQFMITLAPCPWLDGKYAILGRISAGMRVVEQLGRLKASESGVAADKVRISKCVGYKGKTPVLNESKNLGLSMITK